MRVVVFGASGVQGAAQVAALSRAGHDPVAVSRNPKPLDIDEKSIETFALDFDNAHGLDKVLEHGEIIFLNLPSTSFQTSEPVIAAAKKIGEAAAKASNVKLIVFNTSMPVPDESKGIRAQDDRREIRRLLRATGIPVISIQPVVFLENLLEGWARPPLVERDTIVYCHQESLEVSWICHHDIAQFMMAAMKRPDLDGRNFAVAGPETVCLPQLTEKLSRAWNRSLKYESQTVDDFCEKISQAMKDRSSLDLDRVVSDMRKAYTYYRESDEFKPDMEQVLKELPVELTLIEEWARLHPLPSRA
ncbi:hypothetical protein PFICI_14437 [Pestalotiopsis fici W106-1]|uniref:NmrA-like domain-containing protein n=1 Tax=Pestalotiopsis fici (strain W106-1 / CGMCC3.15140) TaxID=1229662 RepID=W3WKZ8_PESFW|nr:uncharacterized protein PFICI_14437 [Pestalotiopsis fici W106-1]ETS73491.1 hypothetical protein PFICI_14437 [Pestalotiopsis fici W106-1]